MITVLNNLVLNATKLKEMKDTAEQSSSLRQKWWMCKSRLDFSKLASALGKIFLATATTNVEEFKIALKNGKTKLTLNYFFPKYFFLECYLSRERKCTANFLWFLCSLSGSNIVSKMTILFIRLLELMPSPLFLCENILKGLNRRLVSIRMLMLLLFFYFLQIYWLVLVATITLRSAFWSRLYPKNEFWNGLLLMGATV